jgi:acyl-CoA thioester hydrolase
MMWEETVETVRFNEIDQLGIAWHGHYLTWFEIGRIALLRRFDLLPQDMVALGYFSPVIRLTCEYKHPAVCGDQIVIKTTAFKPEIAAMVFKAEIERRTDHKLLARSETTQVLMTSDHKMIYRMSGEIETRVRRLLDYCCTP